MSAAGTIRIGVSGWTYDGWDGEFYPADLPKSERLAWAAERLDSIEVNGSFYSLLTPDVYRGWHAATPADFRFAVKGSRFITHNKKLGDVRTPLANFLASGVLRLEEKLGPLLWQLPGHLGFDRERVEAFLDLLPKDTQAAAELAREHDDRVEDVWTRAGGRHRLRHAIEPRHESFFDPEFGRVARRAGVAIVFSDAPDWPWTEELTAGFAYLRLHGTPELYASPYGDAELDRLAERIRAWSEGREPEDADRITGRKPPRRKTRDVYVYFDNDERAHAPRNALALIERLEGDGSGS